MRTLRDRDLPIVPRRGGDRHRYPQNDEKLGAQNLYWATDGAVTGEVSGSTIRWSGCSHVGHGHWRRFFGEADEIVLKKTVAALDAGLTPIVSVGEREEKNAERC